MGQKYLIDSNVLIDYTALRLPKSGSDFVEHLFDTDFSFQWSSKLKYWDMKLFRIK